MEFQDKTCFSPQYINFFLEGPLIFSGLSSLTLQKSLEYAETECSKHKVKLDDRNALRLNKKKAREYQCVFQFFDIFWNVPGVPQKMHRLQRY